MRGKFITVEGTDGAGKSTQIELLIRHLKEQGQEVIFTREPGGTSIGEKIREIILDTENSTMNSITETLLYAASRAQHVGEKIMPAVAEGKIVLCDRFLDSSIAYQGYARGLEKNMIETINAYAIDGMIPDLTLFFDLPPEIGIQRKRNMHQLDRMETEKLEFHLKVYEGYQGLLQAYPERMKRVDASQSVEAVHVQVLQYIKELFSND